MTRIRRNGLPAVGDHATRLASAVVGVCVVVALSLALVCRTERCDVPGRVRLARRLRPRLEPSAASQ
jgi:hypothetical protein